MIRNSLRLDNLQRLLAICGMAGPVLFMAIFTILGFVTADYSPVKHFVSQLGAIGAQYAAVQNTSFVLTGGLIMAFAVGLYRAVNAGKARTIGPALVVVVGIGMMGAGIFSEDLLPQPPEPTFSAFLHRVFAAIAFLAVITAIFAYSLSLPRDALWRHYRPYSLVTGIAASGLVVLTGLSVPGEGGIPTLQPWAGLIQRLFALVWLLWIEVMAIRLLRLPGSSARLKK